MSTRSAPTTCELQVQPMYVGIIITACACFTSYVWLFLRHYTSMYMEIIHSILYFVSHTHTHIYTHPTHMYTYIHTCSCSLHLACQEGHDQLVDFLVGTGKAERDMATGKERNWYAYFCHNL